MGYPTIRVELGEQPNGERYDWGLREIAPTLIRKTPHPKGDNGNGASARLPKLTSILMNSSAERKDQRLAGDNGGASDYDLIEWHSALETQQLYPLVFVCLCNAI